MDPFTLHVLVILMPEWTGGLRLLRPEDLLVLEVGLSNLQVSGDGARLVRVDPAQPALLMFVLPYQHVAERAFFEFETSTEQADDPPVQALAAGPSRLVFALPDGLDGIALTPDALLDWTVLVPQLAANALPEGDAGAPRPALPSPAQTAIEFPYRLFLSPDSNAGWGHRTAPFSSHGHTELWHSRLVGAGQSTVPLRAIGRRPVPDSIRSSLTDEDLNDLVTLTSDFGISPKGAQELGMSLGQWQQRLISGHLFRFHYEPTPLESHEFMITALGATAQLRGNWEYPPMNYGAKPSDEDLALLGMPNPSMESYEHVAGVGRDQFVRVVRRGRVHPGHPASLVKVTERRFEPYVVRTVHGPDGPGAVFGTRAYLRQYFQVIIQRPNLDYAELASLGAYGPFEGREMPLRMLRLTTLVSPKIDLPWPPPPALSQEDEARQLYSIENPQADIPGLEDPEMQPYLQAAMEGAFHEPFWIRVGHQDFGFGVQGTDWEGRQVSFMMPLMFVPDAALALDKVDDVLQAFDAAEAENPGRKRQELHNQIMAVADHGHTAPGSTRVPVTALTFKLQEVAAAAKDQLLKAGYFPGWVLLVDQADVHVEAAERITGPQPAVTMRFNADYLEHGIGSDRNAAGLFGDFPTIKLGFSGDKGGGVARPSSTLDRLSTRQGAMSAAFTAPLTAATLATLFGDAKLFGSVPLAAILSELDAPDAAQFAASRLNDTEIAQVLENPGTQLQVPLLKVRPIITPAGLPAVEARYLWSPAIKSPTGPFGFLKVDDAVLVLDSRTVTFDNGTGSTATLLGELRNFSLEFAEVISLTMHLLKFSAETGRKPDVTAEGFGVDFLGPLQFVNSLQQILPADGFSDPPSVEVTTAGISAGYTLGIPTVGVGIFSLQNLSLSAMLSIPFNDQPAGFRFAISERHSPFIVTVTLFGGGGFFALGVGANGLESLEAAIEFGGSVSLNLGVASGGVTVMAGIYFGMTGTSTTLTGYLRCGGYLSVLGLIGISIEFYLAFTYRNKGDGDQDRRSEIWGQASLSVSVKVACFSKSVTLSIERRFAGAAGDPSFDQVMDPDDWQQYCLAFAG
ncbi:hypothetical protein [Pseudarthrobacter oxydans]|uniref:hypothetical protein n=1 Tax=Pseudarthrobacter oxydans TaxID=1671 RepID=UPI0035E538A1